MKKSTYLFIGIFALISLFATACSSDDDKGSEGADIDMKIDGFSVRSYGNGAVTKIDDSVNDNEKLKIVQTIPSIESYGSGYSVESEASMTPELQKRIQEAAESKLKSTKTLRKYPAELPISFFFNDKIYIHSLKDNVEVIVDGVEIKGNIVLNESSDGYAILTFTPNEKFEVNKSISITLKKGIQDKAGNPMYTDVNLLYETVAASTKPFEANNWGFEKSNAGIVFLGDGGIVSSPIGSLQANTGNKFAAISTGREYVSNSTADQGTTSMVILGPINQDLNVVNFSYNFISAEFNDYVGTEFDDCALMTVTGPKGSYTKMFTSVNMIGKGGNTQITDIPNMPDRGDSYAGETGWISTSINFAKVGSPAYVTFVVSDVGDTVYSSILAIDDISF